MRETEINFYLSLSLSLWYPQYRAQIWIAMYSWYVHPSEWRGVHDPSLRKLFPKFKVVDMPSGKKYIRVTPQPN